MTKRNRSSHSALERVMPEPTTDMRDYIKEEAALAHTYAVDGAYHSAARVLTELALAVKAHAVTSDERIRKLTKLPA